MADSSASATSDEMDLPDGRRLPLREWESEVLVRSAACILLLRGSGMVLGSLATAIALTSDGASDVEPSLVGAAVFVLLPTAALAVLSRSRFGRGLAVATVVPWMLLVAGASPGMLMGARMFEVRAFTTHPLLLMFVSAFLIPDAFAVFALVRRGAKALAPHQPIPLAPILHALRTRPTGGVVVAAGMVALAFLSSALLAFCLPALSYVA